MVWYVLTERAIAVLDVRPSIIILAEIDDIIYNTRHQAAWLVSERERARKVEHSFGRIWRKAG